MADEHNLKYQPIPVLTLTEVEDAIQRNVPQELLDAVLSAALYAKDQEWAQDVCLRLAFHPHSNVRGNAILGFGHIARVHRYLDRGRVQPIVEGALADPDEYVRGHAADAVDDIKHFLRWQFLH